jgi:hypothetical protein
MSALDSLLGSVRRVILMESKIQDLADGLKEVSRRVVDHEGRLIRIETLVELAQRRSAPLRLGTEGE